MSTFSSSKKAVGLLAQQQLYVGAECSKIICCLCIWKRETTGGTASCHFRMSFLLLFEVLLTRHSKMTYQKSQEIRNEIYKFLYHSYGHNNCAKSKKYDINKYAYNYVLLLSSNNWRILWSINHSFVHIAVIATNIK